MWRFALTRDFWPLLAVGFNVLSHVCILNSSVGNRGYASWVPEWMPSPFTMAFIVLPALGVGCAVATLIAFSRPGRDGEQARRSSWYLPFFAYVTTKVSIFLALGI